MNAVVVVVVFMLVEITVLRSIGFIIHCQSIFCLIRGAPTFDIKEAKQNDKTHDESLLLLHALHHRRFFLSLERVRAGFRRSSSGPSCTG